jgi:hypothetical protein
MSLRKRGLASNSISTTLNGIFHFYEMNDVILNKKKINMFKPELLHNHKERRNKRSNGYIV